jgi:LytS/YehU family sensor histidine kinase
MQLDPHFLFNTLNGIMALIQENPQAAQRTVARLSEFLRLTLENSGVQEVPMQKELEFLDRYLQIEQLRFGDRLTVQQDVDPATLGGLVPSLILQPLVENAIKHGVAERRGPATILIQAARDDGRLVIHVRDNGGGIPSTPQEGIGLTNTRQRLQRLYGDEHVFELSSLEGGGVDVLLSIPYHEQGVFGVRRG